MAALLGGRRKRGYTQPCLDSKRDAADKAARAEAEAVIQRWNDQLALGRDMLWSPTMRAALLAGTRPCGRLIALAAAQDQRSQV
jgi:hypothetical protein